MLQEFLTSERSLYLYTGIIGVISLIVGFLFLLLSSHKSFAITMLVLGIIEASVMFTVYAKYDEKITTQTTAIEQNSDAFITKEVVTMKAAINSFFWLKLGYAIGLVLIALLLSFYGRNELVFGIGTALIIHLAMAISIDNFGERYTKVYYERLMNHSKM